MKRIVTLLMTGLLAVMLCPTSVLAKSNPDVYYTVERTADTTYTVSVVSNGKVTDGVTEITYDASTLTCKKAGVVVSDNIDLYSANVEDGKVKIAYISEKPIKAGNFITVTFDVSEGYTDKNVSVTVACEAHDKNGKALTTGEKVNDSANNASKDEQKQESSKNPENKKEEVADSENTTTSESVGKKNNNKKTNKKQTTDEAQSADAEFTVEETQPADEAQAVEETQTVEITEEADKVPMAAAEETANEAKTVNMPLVIFGIAVLGAGVIAVVTVTRKKAKQEDK